MPSAIVVAGLDGRSLLLEAPVLRRDGHVIEEKLSARALIEALVPGETRLVVLGARLPDVSLPETVRRIRRSAAIRNVSILALIPAAEPAELDGQTASAGANAVLRRPLDPQRLQAWIAKLLAVSRRVEARVGVQGQVVGMTPSSQEGQFQAITFNLSTTGLLLASPVRLATGRDLELDLSIPPAAARLRVLGRVVREAGEIGWPYSGYGIEFLSVSPQGQRALEAIVTRGEVAPTQPSARESRGSVVSTIRRETWVYEVLEPVRQSKGWQCEIRRAPQDQWSPGGAGPFYVVEGATAQEALDKARHFLQRFA